LHCGVRVHIAHLLTDNAKESFSGDKGRGVLYRRLTKVWLRYCVYDAVPEPLEGEAEAEDDVVGDRHPQRAGNLKEALANTELLERPSRSFARPFERIESLHSLLRFRVSLGDGIHNLEVLR
jgi:hypothetical protein